MMNQIFIIIFLLFLVGCGKVGPLSLPEDQVNKAVITYPCDDSCLKRLEEEKKRQQSVVVETE